MNTFGLERRDARNLIAVAVIVTLVVTVTADGPLGVRVAAGALAGAISGVAFVVSTLLINRYKPEYW